MFLLQEFFYLILGVIFNFGGHHSTAPIATKPQQGTIQTQGDHGSTPVYPDP